MKKRRNCVPSGASLTPPLAQIPPKARPLTNPRVRIAEKLVKQRRCRPEFLRWEMQDGSLLAVRIYFLLGPDGLSLPLALSPLGPADHKAALLLFTAARDMQIGFCLLSLAQGFRTM